VHRPLRHALDGDGGDHARQLTRSNLLIGSKQRVAGLTLRATDADSSSGSGPEVAGPAMAIVMTMTGRTVALDELDGEGVETLRARM
jgi:hypothetical protein